LFSYLVFFCIVLLSATATERINDDDDDDDDDLISRPRHMFIRRETGLSHAQKVNKAKQK